MNTVEGTTPKSEINAAEPHSKPPSTKKTVRKKVGSFRATDAEMALCRAKAKKQCKSLSAYALMAMLNRRDRRPCVPEINESMQKFLGRAVGSLNQIANVFNRAASEAQQPLRILLADLLGGDEAERWLAQMNSIREGIKHLRLELQGVGLKERDTTLDEPAESNQNPHEHRGEPTPEKVS